MLKGDVVFWLGVGVLLLASVPYVAPVFDSVALYNWGWVYADVPVGIVTFLAVVVGIRRLPHRPERQFWSLVGAAYGVGLVIETGNAFVPWEAQTPALELALSSGYLVYYLALILAAVASRNGAGGSGAWRLYWIRALGLGVIAMGFLLYFESVPYQLDLVPYPIDPLGEEPWYPGLFLYAVLDVVVCAVFFRIAGQHPSARWKGILTGFAIISAMHAVLDTAEAVLYLEPFFSMDLPPALDLFWYVPELVLLVVARRYLADPQEPRPSLEVRIEPKTEAGSLLVGLLALPLLHTTLYYFGVLSTAFQGTREGVVAGYLVVMGVVMLLYFRTLEGLRERSRRALKLSEERYRSFVGARSDCVYRAEAVSPIYTGDTVEAQVGAIEHLSIAEESGEGAGTVLGGSTTVGLPLLELIPEATRARFTRRWIDSGYLAECEVCVSADGEDPRYFQFSLTGIVDGERLVRAWATRSEVTERRRAALENERLARELEQARKMESLGTLAGGIAHDFNNLLVPIMGFSELAQYRVGVDDDEVRKSLGQVHRASQLAADLVDQILAVSRDQPRREVAFDVPETVEAALSLLRPGLPRRIALETRLNDCPSVMGDPSRIHQVVMNLCTNAAQAIGGQPGRIRLVVDYDPEVDLEAAPRGWVVLSVDDDGAGVDETVAHRVFDPFFTTKPTGEGTGLGLSVVHGIVMSHGGRVTLESSAGAGTTVVVRLPAADAPLAAVPVGLSSDVGPLSVLVVDDEVAVAAATGKILEAVGHSVTVATAAPDALDLLHDSEGFDVVVTDYAMPDMTGVELAAAVRQAAPKTGIVLSSGYSFNDTIDTEQCVHLRKPFTAAQLAAAVGEALRSS